MKLKVALIIVLALFVSIFLHELGHSLAFRRNGIEVEKVSVGAIWELKLTVFTDSGGTQYEVGPLPLWGYTKSKDTERPNNLAQEIEIDLAGVAVNALIALFLTPWHFLLRRRYRQRGADFADSFIGKIFKVFIFLNLLLPAGNVLWLSPGVDGGRLVYFVISQRFGEAAAASAGLWLGISSLLLFWFWGFDLITGAINKIYGWTGWPGPSNRRRG